MPMGLASDVLITEFVVVQLATVSGYFDYKALNESPYNRVARVTRVLQTNWLCH